MFASAEECAIVLENSILFVFRCQTCGWTSSRRWWRQDSTASGMWKLEVIGPYAGVLTLMFLCSIYVVSTS